MLKKNFLKIVLKGNLISTASANAIVSPPGMNLEDLLDMFEGQ